MTKVNTGGYDITPVGEDLSEIPYCPPRADTRMVKRLMRGNAAQGEYAYISPSGKVSAAKYLDSAKLTKTEYLVKQMISQGIGVLDEPVENLTPMGGKVLMTEGLAPTVEETTDILASASRLSKGQIFNAIGSLVAKGQLVVSK